MADAAAAAVDTGTLILDAARSRLLADGYAGLSTRKVAEEAGVPVSQLHYHFGSKQGLILALFEEENQRRLARQTAHVRRGRAVVAALRARLRLPRGRPGLRLRAGAAGADRRRLVERASSARQSATCSAAGLPCSPRWPGRPSAATGSSARSPPRSWPPWSPPPSSARSRCCCSASTGRCCRSARHCDASGC